MYPPISLLTALSFAISTTCAQSSSEAVTVTPSPGRPPDYIHNSTVNDTLVYSCPPLPTVFLNVTQYVPMTTTATASFLNTTTQSITIYRTIISTNILTSTEIVAETSTTVSPSPTTATATKEIFPYTTTSRVTSITLCPSRIVNLTFTAVQPFPTDWTWGCPPGWLCKPARENCNFEVGLPDRNFYCTSMEIRHQPGTLASPSTPSTLISTWPRVISGSRYQIFVVDEVLTLTSTTIIEPTPTVGARQAQTSIPGACYPWCNNCLLEAQANGKTSALCVPGSAFEVSLEQCEECITYHKTDDSGTFVQIAPQFQQFLDYCDQYSTVAVTTSVTTPTMNAAGSTYSVVSSTFSTTVAPKSSTPLSSTGPQMSVTTTVATTPTSPTSVPPSSTPLSESPYTTTATIPTTIYSGTTITGSGWSQVTIIMPVAANSTTTIYGSDLTNSATLVLPESAATSSLVATMTVTPISQASATPSEFPSAAPTSKFSPGEPYWRMMVLGPIVLLMLALSL
ncbi:uncharacterized protein Z518_10617 [Rhinocladiella mackenziei CBS 650.93]|uniref:Glycoprotein X n=1 Tax=Rhinocladiella mackenziei CBS 650.93 TaxID=1442369 RepID=A0A0D2FEK9_9EURO|nr:uncharacterized protein Z518_10617 [Rhinocladiella mackenziei CBS 650.93]KIX00477.1 hypothetical protein Z518_10617 [Rhinocladiella mackenziei CBS 650.93]